MQQPVRDRNTSIWQSAVRQTLVNRDDLSDDDKKLAEYGVSLHAKSAENGTALPDPIPVPVPGGALKLKSRRPHQHRSCFQGRV